MEEIEHLYITAGIVVIDKKQAVNNIMTFDAALPYCKQFTLIDRTLASLAISKCTSICIVAWPEHIAWLKTIYGLFYEPRQQDVYCSYKMPTKRIPIFYCQPGDINPDDFFFGAINGIYHTLLSYDAISYVVHPSRYIVTTPRYQQIDILPMNRKQGQSSMLVDENGHGVFEGVPLPFIMKKVRKSEINDLRFRMYNVFGDNLSIKRELNRIKKEYGHKFRAQKRKLNTNDVFISDWDSYISFCSKVSKRKAFEEKIQLQGS